jgi:hypothetical protein
MAFKAYALGEARGYDRPLIAIYKKKGYLPRVAFSHANALSIWPPAKNEA